MNDVTLMQIAFLVARESKCVSHQVGAVISKNGRIISTGINGTKSGLKNCDQHSKEEGWMITPTDDIRLPERDVNLLDKRYFLPDGITHAFYILNQMRFIKIEIDNSVFVWDAHKSRWCLSTIKKEDVLKRAIYENPNYRTFVPKHYTYRLNQVDRDKHSLWASRNEVHAEKNAVLYAAKQGLSIDGATMHVTLSPCFECAKDLPMTGISRIVYCDLYDRNASDWESKLRESGVVVDRIDRKLLTSLNWS